MPQVSVIVPVYNVEKYLSECIESILSQTFTDFELILVNDGSTDNSPSVCDNYARKDPRIRVIHQANQGQGAARNVGVNSSNSEWITFIDSDDIVHPQMLECLFNTAYANEVSISSCSVYEGIEPPCDFLSSVSPLSSLFEICENGLIEKFENDKYFAWIACAKLIKKSIISQTPFTPFRIYEDNAVVLKWLCQTETVAIIESALYFYRVNHSSTTKSVFSEKKLDRLWALNEIYEFSKFKGLNNLAFVLAKLYLDIMCSYFAKTNIEIGRKDLAKVIKKDIHRIYSENKQNKFEKKQRLYIYETLHPHLIKVYWILVSIKQKLFKNSIKHK